MSAPFPTLLEKATIDRLGMFEKEQFEEIVGHGDHSLVCESDTCEKPATLRVVCAFCNLYIGVTCDPCEQIRRSAQILRRVACTTGCGKVTVGWSVATRTVPL